jgi:hypothetical protein
LPIDQVGGERRQSIVLTIGEAVLDCNVLVFDIAGLVQAPVKRGDGQCVARLAEQESDHRHLLRPRGERPRNRRAAERDDKLSPSDVDCHVPSRGGQAHAMEAPYHALIA